MLNELDNTGQLIPTNVIIHESTNVQYTSPKTPASPDELQPINEDGEQEAITSISGKGLFGKVERLPIALKLFITTIIINVAFVAIGIMFIAVLAANIKASLDSKSFIDSAKPLTDLMAALRFERQLSTRLMNNGYTLTTEQTQQHNQAMATTDTLRAAFLKTVKLDQKYDTFPDSVENARALFAAKIFDHQVPTLYSGYLTDVLTVGVSQSLGNKQTYSTSMYVSTVAMVEAILGLTTLGETALNPGKYNSGMTFSYYSFLSRFITQLPQWDLSVPSDLSDKMQNEVGYSLNQRTTITPTPNNVASGAAVLTILNIVYAKGDPALLPNATGPYSYAALQANTTILNDAVERVLSFTLAYLYKRENDTYASSVAQIVVFIILGVVFFILGLLSQIFMAKSITGPWERLNRKFNETIKKFIPSGLLKMLKTKQLIELELGKNANQPMIVLRAKIKDFDKLTVEPQKALDILNNMLLDVCPFVRNNYGFIDRYTSDGFSALFTNKDQAMRAAMEIHNRSLTTHQRFGVKNKGVSMCCAVHGDDVFVGTIGEDQRMDCVIFGRASGVINRMMNLASRLGVDVIISSTALPPTASCVRRLGNLLSCGSVFEAYDIDTHPAWPATVEKFQEATEELDNKNYYGARRYLNAIQDMDPNDPVTKSYIDVTERYITKCEAELEKASLNVFLHDAHLLQLLENYCINDRCAEDIYLWKKISKEYNHLENPIDRKKLAREISKDFVEKDGKFSVQISESLRRFILKRTNDSEFIPPRDFFKELHQEVRLNINATINQFKRTEECKVVFMARITKET